MTERYTFINAFMHAYKYFIVLIVCLITSACSSTYLKTFDKTGLAAKNNVSVAIETNCNNIAFGGQKLNESLNHIKKAVTDYGYKIVHGNQADFLLHFICSKESDLNGGFLPNGVSAMVMVSSLSVVPTYWPSNLWVEMEVYDLRTHDLKRVDSRKASYVSQERMVWAPFFLFKLAYEFGLEKYDYEEFYEGISASSYSLISKAESNAILE